MTTTSRRWAWTRLSSVRAVVALVIATGTTGCATRVYDPLPPTELEMTTADWDARRAESTFSGIGTEAGRTLRDGIIHTETRRRQLAAARRHALVDDGQLGSAGLVGTTATTAAAVFRGPADLVAGLALGTGALQTTRSLYFQRGYDITFGSAERAMGCLSRAGRVSLDAHVRAETYRSSLALERAVIAQLAGLDLDAAGAALAMADTGYRQADGIATATASLGRRLPVAADSIMDAASQQLTRQMPDAQAYNAALQAIGALQSLKPASTSAAPPAKAGGPIATSSGDRTGDEQRLRTAIANVAALSANMEAARGDFDTKSNEALKVCGFTPMEAPTAISFVGLQNNALTLKKGEAISFAIQGGSGNYFTSVIGSRPPGVDVALLGASVDIRVDANTGKAGAFQLRVRDAAAKVAPADIAVTIKE